MPSYDVISAGPELQSQTSQVHARYETPWRSSQLMSGSTYPPAHSVSPISVATTGTRFATLATVASQHSWVLQPLKS